MTSFITDLYFIDSLISRLTLYPTAINRILTRCLTGSVYNMTFSSYILAPRSPFFLLLYFLFLSRALQSRSAGPLRSFRVGFT